MIDAVLKEVEHSIDAYSIPTKEYLLNATMKNPVLWDPVESFDRFANQSDSSYNEKNGYQHWKRVNRFIHWYYNTWEVHKELCY